MAETHGGGVFGVLVRILCVAGGAVVGAFVLAVLAPGGAGTAHAAGRAFRDRRLLGRAGLGELGGRPARRGHSVTAGEPTVGADPTRPADDAGSAPVGRGASGADRRGVDDAGRHRGSSGGSTDGGPSIASLAILSAALVAVLWLSQRLRHGEVRARSAFVTLSLERPG